jgi:hypothetical protein
MSFENLHTLFKRISLQIREMYRQLGSVELPLVFPKVFRKLNTILYEDKGLRNYLFNSFIKLELS